MDTEVLIVGAGPTGLMLANQLSRRGVRVTIVDRHSGPAQQTRAVGVQARTLEIYAQLGLADEALALGLRAEGANLWANGERTARVPLGEAGRLQTRFPFLLLLGQDDNETILGRRLAAAGVTIAWNTELVGLKQSDAQVSATLREADGTRRVITASWVAGCDGAQSFVRSACGIDYPGAPYEHVFYVADTIARGDMVEREVNVYLWRKGFHLFFPLRGEHHWRLAGIVPAALRGREGLCFEDVLPSIRAEAGEGLRFESCHWFSTYRIHHRRAASLRERRCFLLGDAAHIHSPVGAQGMNTGLQDAYNLAWKLALVVHGHAAPSLLDSYEAERLPVAKRLLATTDRMFTLVVAEGWFARLLRTRLLARLAAIAMRRGAIRRQAFRAISQIGVRYAGSPLSRNAEVWPKGAPQPGERFPWLHLQLAPGAVAVDLYAALGDTRFNLLLIGQGEAVAVPRVDDGLLAMQAIVSGGDNAAALSAAGIPARSFFLLRPDGHIALTGLGFEGAMVERWFADLRGD